MKKQWIQFVLPNVSNITQAITLLFQTQILKAQYYCECGVAFMSSIYKKVISSNVQVNHSLELTQSQLLVLLQNESVFLKDSVDWMIQLLA